MMRKLRASPSLIAVVLVGACSDMPAARTQSEIRAIAEDVAEDAAQRRTAALEEEISDLTQKVEGLETENRLLKAELDRLSENDKIDTESSRRLFRNDRIFADRLGIPMEGN